MPKVLVLFSINYRTNWGENVCISGSVRELGQWNPGFCVKCQCSGETWSAFVLMDTGVQFEYKVR